MKKINKILMFSFCYFSLLFYSIFSINSLELYTKNIIHSNQQNTKISNYPTFTFDKQIIENTNEVIYSNFSFTIYDSLEIEKNKIQEVRAVEAILLKDGGGKENKPDQVVNLTKTSSSGNNSTWTNFTNKLKISNYKNGSYWDLTFKVTLVNVDISDSQNPIESDEYFNYYNFDRYEPPGLSGGIITWIILGSVSGLIVVSYFLYLSIKKYRTKK